VTHLNAKAAVLTLALCLMVGCAKPAVNAATNAAATPGPGPATPAAASADSGGDDVGGPLDCAKLFTAADAAGIVTKPVTVSDYPLRTRSCNFSTAAGNGFNVYADSGVTSEMGWDEVSKSTDRTKYIPIAGVGDQAFWDTADTTEFFAKKGGAYCSVALLGAGQGGADDEFAKPRDAAFAQRLGALCNKVFAAG
jgi:hypothetical protein